jgi:hypothetical protein
MSWLKNKIREWLKEEETTEEKKGRTKAEIFRETNQGVEMVQSVKDSGNDNYLFDFRNYSSGRELTYFNGNNVVGVSIQQEDSIPTESGPHGIQQPEAKKITLAVTPKAVLKELERKPNSFSLENLDNKIVMLKQKSEFVKQYYAKEELTGLIERLELRKKYAEFSAFFEKFDNTDDDKINALLKQYPELVMKTADIFIPEFPDDAVTVMKDYTDTMDKLCGKKPIFYVIAQHEHFHKAFETKDPILLVQSPFGFFWQILGAWDEELLLLSSL